jgi:hypothetical protein
LRQTLTFQSTFQLKNVPVVDESENQSIFVVVVDLIVDKVAVDMIAVGKMVLAGKSVDQRHDRESDLWAFLVGKC